MNASLRRHAGFSLIELLMTMVMVGVLMQIGVPAWRDYARNATVSRAAGSFVQAAHLARANAMRRARHTMLALRAPAQGWKAGWIVYTDLDNDQSYSADVDELVHEQAPLADGVGVELDDKASGTLADGYLRFDPGGFPRNAGNGISNGSIIFALTAARRVQVRYSKSGRIRRCTPDDKGDCIDPGP